MTGAPVLGYAVAEFGGPEVMRWGSVPVRDPGENDVLVDVAYAGVNFLDVHQRSGKYKTRSLPFVPGNEGSGVVAAVGSAVTAFRPGDRVAFAMHNQGSYAERVVASGDRVVAVPDSVSLRDAAGVILQGVTAICLVETVARVRPGQSVVVHSASGGAGAAVAQVARHAGATVLGLVSSPAKRRLALAAGADEVALYDERQGHYAEWVAERTAGGGADAVFDAAGGDLVAEDLAALGRRGHLVLYGQIAGPFSDISPDTLAQRSLTVTYSRISAYLAEPGTFGALGARLFAIVSDGGFCAANLTELPADRAADAHRALVERTSRGKTVLLIGGE